MKEITERVAAIQSLFRKHFNIDIIKMYNFTVRLYLCKVGDLFSSCVLTYLILNRSTLVFAYLFLKMDFLVEKKQAQVFLIQSFLKLLNNFSLFYLVNNFQEYIRYPLKILRCSILSFSLFFVVYF